MELSGTLIRRPVRITSSSATLGWQKSILSSTTKNVSVFGFHSVRFHNCVCNNALVAGVNPSSPAMASNSGHDYGVTRNSPGKAEAIEGGIEKMPVYGLSGSFGVVNWIISMLHQDVYLLGTVMLVFGMGLYEPFVSNLGSAESQPDRETPYRSNLFGLFTLKERPKWLDIKTVNELKTKLGHVIDS